MSNNENSFRKAFGTALILGVLAIGAPFGRAATLSYDVYTLPVGDSAASTLGSVIFDGQSIWATVQNPDGGLLIKLNLSGVILSVTPLGSAPIEMAFDGANVWVTDYTSSDVTIVDAGGNVVKTIPLPGANPEGVLFDGKYIWIANNGVGANSVSKFDVSTQSLIATYPVGLNPDGLAFDGTYIWVTNSYNNDVWKISRDSGAYIDGYGTGIFPLSVIYDGANMWIGNGRGGSAGSPVSGGGSLTKIRASDGATLGTYAVGSVVRGLLFDGTSIWVCNSGDNTVSRLRFSDVALLETYSTGKAPRGVAFDGSKIWIANSGDDTLTVIAPAAAQGDTTTATPFAVAAFGATANLRPIADRGPAIPFRPGRAGAAGILPVTVTKRVVVTPGTVGSMLNLLLDIN
jgi:YVTN family beta-propeller protein